MSYENHWIYQGQKFDSETIEDNFGFVYCVTNKTSGMKYIGKKFFWAMKTKQVKGKKKKIKAESDWKTYYGSNEEVKELVKTLGSANFEREILHLCLSKGSCNYMEMKEQILRDVLLKPDEYHNAFVGGKIHRNHVKNLFG